MNDSKAQREIRYGYLYTDIALDESVLGNNVRKRIDETKKILKKNELYLLMEGVEYPIIVKNDSTLLIPKITNDVLLRLNNLEIVKLKFKKNKRCSISDFPNVFNAEISIIEIDLYYNYSYGTIRRKKRRSRNMGTIGIIVYTGKQRVFSANSVNCECN